MLLTVIVFVLDIIFAFLMAVATVLSIKDNEDVAPLSAFVALLYAANLYVIWRWTKWCM